MAFHGWTIIDVEPSYFQASIPVELLMKPDEHWYRLRYDGSGIFHDT